MIRDMCWKIKSLIYTIGIVSQCVVNLQAPGGGEGGVGVDAMGRRRRMLEEGQMQM